MRRPQRPAREAIVARRRTVPMFGRPIWLAAACAGFAGCAGFWDDVTSREFSVKSVFVSPDPMVVLKESTDGDARAKALRQLKEPRQHGGTQADQDQALQLLTTAAVSEP